MSDVRKGTDSYKPTKYRYDECYAKLVLEKLFPEKYKNLKISDRPDLRDLDNNIGIEVTSCVPEEDIKAIKIYDIIRHSNDDERKIRLENWLVERNYIYSEYCLEHPMKSWHWSGLEYPNIKDTCCKLFLLSVNNKITKLNSGIYEELDEYELYVYSEIFIEDWMPKLLMKELSLYNSKPKKFRYIYLLDLKELYVFDMPNQEIKIQERDERIYGLGYKAEVLSKEGDLNVKN